MSNKQPFPGTDLTAKELIRRVAKHPPKWVGRLPRWSAVGAAFCVGSGYAIAICRESGYDPYETASDMKRKAAPTTGQGEQCLP